MRFPEAYPAPGKRRSTPPHGCTQSVGGGSAGAKAPRPPRHACSIAGLAEDAHVHATPGSSEYLKSSLTSLVGAAPRRHPSLYSDLEWAVRPSLDVETDGAAKGVTPQVQLCNEHYNGLLELMVAEEDAAAVSGSLPTLNQSPLNTSFDRSFNTRPISTKEERDAELKNIMQDLVGLNNFSLTGADATQGPATQLFKAKAKMISSLVGPQTSRPSALKKFVPLKPFQTNRQLIEARLEQQGQDPEYQEELFRRCALYKKQDQERIQALRELREAKPETEKDFVGQNIAAIRSWEDITAQKKQQKRSHLEHQKQVFAARTESYRQQEVEATRSFQIAQQRQLHAQRLRQERLRPSDAKDPPLGQQTKAVPEVVVTNAAPEEPENEAVPEQAEGLVAQDPQATDPSVADVTPTPEEQTEPDPPPPGS